MSNSKEARALNRELREIHKEGLLEKIYERQENGQMAASDEKIDQALNVQEEKKQSEMTQSTAPTKEDVMTPPESPMKVEEDGQSPVRKLPQSKFLG